MFAGIVKERGKVISLARDEQQARLTVEATIAAAGIEPGDSVSVDGCCLTAVEKNGEAIAFDISAETLVRTALGSLEPGAEVNLEPALRAGEPIGGHYVQGHVDAVGRIRSIAPEGDGVRMWIEVPPDVLRFCVEKGSIAVAGVSLTIAELTGDAVAVALIPFTLAATTLGAASPGDRVNLESDVIGKYVERLLGARIEGEGTER